MSRFPGQNGRPLFASATTYDALEVEEGEESEEEQSTEFQETAISDRCVDMSLPFLLYVQRITIVTVFLRIHRSQPSLP